MLLSPDPRDKGAWAEDATQNKSAIFLALPELEGGLAWLLIQGFDASVQRT
jgi:hypothetical protein